MVALADMIVCMQFTRCYKYFHLFDTEYYAPYIKRRGRDRVIKLIHVIGIFHYFCLNKLIV